MNTIEFVEYFNADKLSHIIDNKESFINKMKEYDAKHASDEEIRDYEGTFTRFEKYLRKATCPQGKAIVRYHQSNNRGRFFANGGLSLQSICKQVRHTISAEFYNDIDISNAHPTLLVELCQRSKLLKNKYKCLRDFVDNREKYYGALNCDRDAAKTKYLKVMNGGVCTDEKAELFNDFAKEIDAIHTHLIEKNKEDYDDHCQRLKKSGKDYNFKGSYVNILLCELENEVLMHIFDFYGKPANSVLCFDGIMLPKSVDPKLDECSEYIEAKTGIALKLAVKPMDMAFDLPQTIKPHSFAPKTINKDDPFVWGDFRNKYCNMVFESYDDLIENMAHDLPRVFAPVFKMFIFKINTTDKMFNIPMEKIRHETIDFPLRYKNITKKKKSEEETIESVLFSKVVFNHTSREFKFYNEVVVKPDLDDLRPGEFNLWRGFNAKIVPMPEKSEGLELMLSYIREILANNDTVLFEYILKWLACLVKYPSGPIKAALVIVGKQGIGKNTLTDFLSDFIIGNHVVCEVVGVEPIVQKHNQIVQGKRLYIINEMCSSSGEFNNNFNRLKEHVTGKTIAIEPKGHEVYPINNISCSIMFSNFKNSVHVEDSDRRYCCISPSDKMRGNTEYFGKLRSKCFNQDFGDVFYTYLMDMKVNVVDIQKPPTSSLKDEMTELSKPSCDKFLDAMKSEYKYKVENAEPDAVVEDKVRAADFYNHYRKWCSDNGENAVSNTKFGSTISGEVSGRITRGEDKHSKYYILSSIDKNNK